ncbi:uncharacterized protein FOMMEDRAFT_162362 [Fomitiporia mediterranea MF3/22]|uniref:uncharacterized protein n=1 Tax=Fomitiporia mediterranea (strain MF3/22) TaxID=694068 RepID=UPI0004408189|nr:uncharacterized protein FOMMEDRAFT_162362 [Fomitiporia mediterranea MF3/22]EJC98018.1 hypothetical protein FOMMEDRAFT_162362 [Fomitiporia mediterranea MF3/22]
MYIAGIHVPGPASDLATESNITSSLFLYSVALIRGINKVSDTAKVKGGPIKTNFSTRVAYLVAIPSNKSVQPEFIARFALPDFGLKKETII